MSFICHVYCSLVINWDVILQKSFYNQVSIDNKNNFRLLWEVRVHNYFVVSVVATDSMGEQLVQVFHIPMNPLDYSPVKYGSPQIETF